MPEKMTVMARAEGIRPPAVGLAPSPRAPPGARLPGVQTVRTTIFHVSALVLGPLWFALLVTGWATGLGLLITLLGLPVIWLTLVMARELTAFEAGLARAALGADVGVTPRLPGWRLRQRLADPGAWRGQIYLLLRFGPGLAIACVLLAAWGTTLGLIAAPLWYWAVPDGIELGLFHVDRLWVAFAVIPLGLVAGVVSYALTLASEIGWRRLAEALLPTTPAVAAQPPALVPLRTTLAAAGGVEALCLLLWALTGRTGP
jgi:hypothetical protein